LRQQHTGDHRRLINQDDETSKARL
jgi:hypothetical protein